eukprot:536470_1
MMGWLTTDAFRGYVVSFLCVIIFLAYARWNTSIGRQSAATGREETDPSSKRKGFSARSKELQRRLNVDASCRSASRIKVTVGLPALLQITEENLAGAFIAALQEFAFVVIVGMVECDEEEKGFIERAVAAKVVKGDKEDENSGVDPHRLVFSSKLIGSVSIVRQISPSVHIDEANHELMEALAPYVPVRQLSSLLD